MVNVKKEKKTFKGRARVFNQDKKAILKSKKYPPNITHRNRVIFPAYSRNSWASLEGFSLSVCPPCFSDNYASLLAPKARCTATQTVRHATQTYSVSSRLADAFLSRPEDFRGFLWKVARFFLICFQMLCFPLSGCVRFSPVVKLGRYAAVGMDYVIQVTTVALLVAVHITWINGLFGFIDTDKKIWKRSIFDQSFTFLANNHIHKCKLKNCFLRYSLKNCNIMFRKH